MSKKFPKQYTPTSNRAFKDHERFVSVRLWHDQVGNSHPASSTDACISFQLWPTSIAFVRTGDVPVLKDTCEIRRPCCTCSKLLCPSEACKKVICGHVSPPHSLLWLGSHQWVFEAALCRLSFQSRSTRNYCYSCLLLSASVPTMAIDLDALIRLHFLY